MDSTGLKILENNKNIQSIISVNTNILLRRFRLKFLRIICSTSCYKERVNFENTLYTEILITEMGISNEAKNVIPLNFLRKIKNIYIFFRLVNSIRGHTVYPISLRIGIV
jgi:hypothetical protein